MTAAILSMPLMKSTRNSHNLRKDLVIHNYIGKSPALPGDSKSLTTPYFETLRNADKSADKRRFVRRGSASKSR
jgi:hypothetical protein